MPACKVLPSYVDSVHSASLLSVASVHSASLLPVDQVKSRSVQLVVVVIVVAVVYQYKT